MMLAAKPISSPGRSDKFPPPLMRFLRSNAGNKSRGGRRKKSNTNSTSAAAAVGAQEPSSPKVTCMGQVRVRRGTSSAPSSRRPGKAPARKKRFRWTHHASFCSDFPARIKSKSSCGELWRKWVPFFQGGYCSKPQVELASPEMETRESLGFSSDEEEEEVGFERKAKAFGFDSSSCSPPKNALFLTRCRSAPYRSSSLACRFWGSPNRAEEKTEEEEVEQSKTGEEEVEQSKTEEVEQEQSIENLSHISDEESKTEKISEEKKIEVLNNERVAKSAACIEDLRSSSSSEWPLILTRCKSEPARTAAKKLNPDSLIHSHHQVYVIN